MSALARWFKANGYPVAGYDKTASDLTRSLETEGIEIQYNDDLAAIPTIYAWPDTWVIYTPAIPKDTKVYSFFIAQQNPMAKRAEALGWLTQNHKCLAVSGTHGKTTTSTLLAHLLKNANRNVTAFLGGISSNWNTNLIIGKASEPNHIVVVEADEYDRSFLTLFPDVVVVNAMDPDHLDIYSTAEGFEEGFRLFVDQIKSGGTLIKRYGLPLNKPDHVATALTFDLDFGDIRVQNRRYEEGHNRFDVLWPNERPVSCELGIPGIHNVQNALAAATVARIAGLTNEEIQDGLCSFKGVKRRFEYYVRTPSLVYIDDYAHHPVELNALLDSVKELYPNLKITLLFQPHLFSRTRDFWDEFIAVFSKADCLWLMDIYPARELPIEGVNSTSLLEASNVENKQLVSPKDFPNLLNNFSSGVLLSAGAGDIDRQCSIIKTILNGEESK